MDSLKLVQWCIWKQKQGNEIFQHLKWAQFIGMCFWNFAIAKEHGFQIMFGQQCGMPGGTHHNEHVISSFKCIIFPVLTDEVKYEQMYVREHLL